MKLSTPKPTSDNAASHHARRDSDQSFPGVPRDGEVFEPSPLSRQSRAVSCHCVHYRSNPMASVLEHLAERHLPPRQERRRQHVATIHAVLPAHASILASSAHRPSPIAHRLRAESRKPAARSLARAVGTRPPARSSMMKTLWP